MPDHGPLRPSPGAVLWKWLLNALLVALAISALVLAIAAQGPTWAKFTAGGVVVAVILGTFLFWGGYLFGSRQDPPGGV